MTALLLLAALLAGQRDAIPAQTIPYTVDGVIDADDNRNDDLNFYDAYRLRLNAGTRYRIRVTPGDPADQMMMLELWEPGADLYLATQSSHTPDHPRPQLIFGPPTTREYELRVLNLTSMHVRPPSRTYRLEIVPLTEAEANVVATPESSQPLAWRVWEGRFTADDPTDEGGHRFHEYRLRLTAGQTRFAVAERLPGRPSQGPEPGVSLWIRPASAPADTEVRLTGDTGGSDTPAIAMLRTAESGDYILRVTSSPAALPEGYRVRISE